MTMLLRVPRLYPEMEEATIGQWLIREGEPVAPRAPVVEIITDKVSYEVEAPEGEEELVLLSACAPEKSVLPVESVLAILGLAGTTALPDWRAENERLASERQLADGTSEKALSRETDAAGLTASPTGPAVIVRATPAARRAARAAGVELAEIAKIASSATVTEADVERYLRENG
ncbi:MAG TPA: biotin/lipoyl-containing protein [Armatimonadota bacterium]|nr:biotin/lipoyl-containing protein [Armatimonadota bacterium]